MYPPLCFEIWTKGTTVKKTREAQVYEFGLVGWPIHCKEPTYLSTGVYSEKVLFPFQFAHAQNRFHLLQNFNAWGFNAMNKKPDFWKSAWNSAFAEHSRPCPKSNSSSGYDQNKNRNPQIAERCCVMQNFQEANFKSL